MKALNIINTAIILLFSIAISTAQCFDDGHSPFQNQGWLSCNTSIGPIQERGKTHWLLYDLGEQYTVDELYFWNHNVWGETGSGVKQILIDYSLDKINWTTAGPFTIEKAPGSWKYTGTLGPDMNHAVGRYFLITVVNTWDNANSCAGFGEIKFILGESVDTEDEILALNDFSISPNPAYNEIILKLTIVDNIEIITIYNSIGILVKQLDVPRDNEILVSIEDLISGLYYVTLNTNNGLVTKSFVKG